MDGRINRRKKSAFSNRNGYVGPGTWGHPFLRVQRTHCLPQSLTEGDHDFQDKVRLLRKHKQSSARSYGHGVACERVFQWWQAKRAARERASKRRRKMIILAIFLASSSHGKYVKKSLEDAKKKKLANWETSFMKFRLPFFSRHSHSPLLSRVVLAPSNGGVVCRLRVRAINPGHPYTETVFLNTSDSHLHFQLVTIVRWNIDITNLYITKFSHTVTSDFLHPSDSKIYEKELRYKKTSS